MTTRRFQNQRFGFVCILNNIVNVYYLFIFGLPTNNVGHCRSSQKKFKDFYKSNLLNNNIDITRLYQHDVKFS